MKEHLNRTISLMQYYGPQKKASMSRFAVGDAAPIVEQRCLSGISRSAKVQRPLQPVRLLGCLLHT
jgi:hypothetical protein